MTITVKEVLFQTREALEHGGIPDATLEADILLGATLNIDRAQLYASLSTAVSNDGLLALRTLVDRRLSREPTAYLLEKQEFFGLQFRVTPVVLVPRPETETLVEEAVYIARKRFANCEAVVADVGTGCGAIAVSLALHLPNLRLYATDISEPALALASANARAHGVQDRITFLRGDLLEPLPATVDMLAANLPYLPSDRLPSLEPEVSKFEPRWALDGGPDGLYHIRRMLQQSLNHLNAEASMLLELDPEQMDRVADTALHLYPRAQVRRILDLAGRQRVMVVAR